MAHVEIFGGGLPGPWPNAIVIVPLNDGAIITEVGELPDIGADHETMRHLKAAALRLAKPDSDVPISHGVARYRVVLSE